MSADFRVRGIRPDRWDDEDTPPWITDETRPPASAALVNRVYAASVLVELDAALIKLDKAVEALDEPDAFVLTEDVRPLVVAEIDKALMALAFRADSLATGSGYDDPGRADLYRRSALEPICEPSWIPACPDAR